MRGGADTHSGGSVAKEVAEAVTSADAALMTPSSAFQSTRYLGGASQRVLVQRDRKSVAVGGAGGQRTESVHGQGELLVVVVGV